MREICVIGEDFKRKEIQEKVYMPEIHGLQHQEGLLGMGNALQNGQT